MIRRSTLVLFVVFLILVAVAFFWERSGNSEEVIPTATQQANLLDLDVNNVNRLEITASDGDLVVFIKETEGNWVIEEPEGEIDPAADLGSKIESFIAIRVLNPLESPPPADATGLNNPVYTITVFLDNDSHQEIMIGKDTVTGSGYYTQVANNVFVVDKFTVDNLLDLLNNPPYITPEVTLLPEQESLPEPATPTP